MAHSLVPSLLQERRHQLIDALSKSQRTRCVPALKPTSNSLRSQSTQASVLQSETYSSRQADTWSPRDGTIYLGADSPSHSCSHNLSSLSCSWEDTSAPKQTQAARLPGQVLASTKSRTCAASHFQAFRLNLKSREGRPRKSFGEDPHKEGQFSQCQGSKSDKLEAAPRLPGRVLEDTLSRTCAAAFLTHEPREPRSEQRSEPRSELRPKPQVPTQALPKGKKEVNEPQPSMTPCPRRGELHRSESPRQRWPLSARKESPIRTKISPRSSNALLDTLSSQERLPRPTLPTQAAAPAAPSARRKTIATEHPAVRSSGKMRPTPQAMPERSSMAFEPQVTRYPRHTVSEASQSRPASQELKPRGYPQPTSQSELDRELTESRSIRAGTPSLLIPLPLGTSLPSWARTEAGLSPSQKKLAHSAATRLQRAFRKWWFRNFSSSGPMGFQALRDAVIYLQRWWRLAHARKLRRLHLRRCWKRMSFRILVLQDAASYVQRGWHMVKVRRLRHAAQLAAQVIQRAWRCRLLHLQKEKQRYGMAKLWSWHRRCVAKKRLISGIWKFWQVQHQAAVCVQSVWRGLQTRQMFAESRERLERARDRREIIRRKAQLLDTKQATGCPKPPSKTFKLNSMHEHACPERDDQDRSCQDRAPFRPSGAVAEDLFQKAAQSATPRDGRGMQSRSKRLSYGQTRVDTAAPRSARPVPGGTVSMTTFLASQNALSPSHRRAPSAQSLVRDLTARGCLSSLPRMSPFSPELSGHSDLEAVRNWLSGALPSWRILQVLRVECSGAAAAAYNGVSRTLGPERLLWHGTSWDCVANIAQNGFNRAYGGRHGSKLGRGSYFAEEATFALRFCGRSQHRAIFLAGVLPGRFCRGAEGLVEPPALDAGTRYDSTVDDPANPKVFCVFRDFQAIPLYLAEVASS